MNARLLLVAGMAALTCGTLRAAPPDLAVLPAEVRGVVMFPDGETPVEKMRVRVWNAKTEEIVYKTQTDKNGVFTVPSLEEGSHYVTVGPVRIDMRVLTGRAGVTPQPHGVVVIVPKRMPMIPALIPGAAIAAAVPQIMSP